MSELVEIFGDKVQLDDGGHVDFLLQGEDNSLVEPIVGQKSVGRKRLNYTSGTHRTYPPPPYQTVDSKPDRIGRERCFVQGSIYPCDQMNSRGLRKSQNADRIKSLRSKYRRN